VSRTRRLLTALRSAILGTGPATRPTAQPSRTDVEAGQSGPDATVELDPSAVRRPGWGYAPMNNGALDPGEVVWTWVPFEERDGRGKDRPVLVVATLARGAVLAVQLTSADHSGDADYVSLGVGPWDRDRRPSWAAIDRVFQVWPNGVRREGTFTDAARHRSVETALRRRYGWR
jgi:hypothetical protein